MRAANGMTLKLFAVAGALFVLLGMAGFLHPEIKMAESQRDMVVGEKTITVETQRVYLISKPVSALLLFGGAMMIFLSTRKS